MFEKVSKASERARPLLVLVGGAPGAGKTTLARQIADALDLPLLSKDFFKELLADSLKLRTREQVQPIGSASYAMLFGVANRLLQDGVNLIVECNFHRGVSEGELRPLLDQSRAVLVHCQTTRANCLDRFRRRAERGERHWVHFDREWLAEKDAGGIPFSWDVYEPLDVDVPILRVDTTAGYAPELPEILTFIRSASRVSP